MKFENRLYTLHCKLANQVASSGRYQRILAVHSANAHFSTDDVPLTLRMLWPIYETLWPEREAGQFASIGGGLTVSPLIIGSGDNVVDFGLVVEDGVDRIAIFEGNQNNNPATPMVFIVMGTSDRAFEVIPTMLKLAV